MSLLVLLVAVVVIVIYENNSKQKIMNSKDFRDWRDYYLNSGYSPKSRRPIMHLRNVVRAISLRITILAHKP